MIKKTDVESHIAFIRIPKPLIHDPKYKQLSLNAKFMYGLLYDRLQLSLKNKWYDEDNNVFQYYKNEQFMLDLPASEKTVIKTKKELAKAGLLKEVRQGINQPNRLYLSAITGTVKSTGQELENLQLGTGNNTGQELENLQGNKTEKSKTEKSKNNIVVLVTDIVNYLNDKAGTKFKASSQATQKLIQSRMKEGYDIDDFKHVIDVKVAEWKDTDFAKFLRPATLFGNKFENYVNQTLTQKQASKLAYAVDERLDF
ncbi:conserved phage C-terminal domain-containing protein [Streptococcus ictaluri]|nr:conserved phage C-terminal domain-containing protein [Streptococcus pyogenes]HES1441352.1 conserved phage C-terminal domain-containing protein [Streptococcus pyogenes]